MNTTNKLRITACLHPTSVWLVLREPAGLARTELTKFYCICNSINVVVTLVKSLLYKCTGLSVKLDQNGKHELCYSSCFSTHSVFSVDLLCQRLMFWLLRSLFLLILLVIRLASRLFQLLLQTTNIHLEFNKYFTRGNTIRRRLK